MHKTGKKSVVTIKTVARQSGVSISTVSRVLNNPDCVTEEKQQRVLDAIKNLNYTPNPVAQALGTNKVQTIAIVVPNIVNACIAEIIRGVIEELDKSSFNVLIFDSNQNFERETGFVDLLPRKMIDGAVFIAVQGKEIDFSPLSKKMPVVLVDQPENTSFVDQFCIDDTLGMKVLVNHLKDLGHQRLGLLAGDLSTNAGVRRVKTFRNALNEAELVFDPEGVVFCGWAMEGGVLGIKKLMKRKNPPTGIIAASDVIALGALGGAYSMGFRIPRDFSLTGYDNAPGGMYSIPPLTTLTFPNYKLGRMAARAVLRRLEKTKVKQLKKIFPVELKYRQSSGPVPGEGADGASASRAAEKNRT